MSNATYKQPPDIECPYCGMGQEIDTGDGYGEEGVTHEKECVECEKTFIFTTSISFYYDAKKADCLNGGEHQWVPAWGSGRQCSVCDLLDRKPPEVSKC